VSIAGLFIALKKRIGVLLQPLFWQATQLFWQATQ